MLRVIGASDIEALFASVPETLRHRGPLALGPPRSEQSVAKELRRLATANANPSTHDWFLGAGAYAHFIPAAVDAITSRSEFTTSYTPYQGEISQGTLQTIFEWQSMICDLTGLDVSNASLYDGASASAEAALMAMRVTRRSKVVLCDTVHPHTREVLRTYLGGLPSEIVALPGAADGRSALDEAELDEQCACLVIQQPNFFGCVEDLAAAAKAAHDVGALLVVTVSEALSLALFRAPGEVGADIVCGEAQSFGVPVSFGGPVLGFLAARQKFLRQIPGRLCGETQDAHGKRGFVLTLSTREQHIRRERATSNICTNQGLCLLMATVYLALHGPRGLAELAEQNLAKAEYAKARIAATRGLELLFDAPTFNEFVVRVPEPADRALARALAAGAVGGFDLGRTHPELGPALLVCTTELCEREAIDRLISALAGDSA